MTMPQTDDSQLYVGGLPLLKDRPGHTVGRNAYARQDADGDAPAADLADLAAAPRPEPARQEPPQPRATAATTAAGSAAERSARHAAPPPPTRPTSARQPSPEPSSAWQPAAAPAEPAPDTARQGDSVTRLGPVRVVRRGTGQGAGRPQPPRPAPLAAPAGYVDYFGDAGELFDPARDIERRGWRGWVQSLTFGLWTPPFSPLEAEMAEARRLICGPVSHHSIVMSNQKGGVTKTTTALGVGTTFSELRREAVLFIDANTRGNAVSRTGVTPNGRHVYDLLGEVNTVRTANDLHRYTNRTHSGLEVLASDRSQQNKRQLKASDYQLVTDIAHTFHRVTVTDTGYDLAVPSFPEVMARADTLVIATTRARDAANDALDTLEAWADARGEEFIARHAVLAITDHSDSSRRAKSLEEIRAKFEPRVRKSVVIPYDAALDNGRPFVWHRMAQPTKDAYTRLTAAVAEDFTPR